jgi:hypothetical protein
MFLGLGGGAPTRVAIHRAAFHRLRVRARTYRAPRRPCHPANSIRLPHLHS